MRSLKNINNMLYTDKMTVKRYMNVTNEDMSTKHSLSVVEGLKDIPCMLSIKTPDNPVPDSINTINQLYTVFTEPSIDITSGDILEVTRYDKLYRLTAGEPIMYLYHQEIPTNRKEWS